jgi:hypothetical protein
MGWRVGGLVGCLAVIAASASAQSANPPTRQPANPEQWTVIGQVQLGKRAGPQPVPNHWVVVHRIASDSTGKVAGGPLDSALTDRNGRFRIRYPHFGEQATYIAITTFEGVSYISSPFARPTVTGDDATIMVFDTTSPPYPIGVAGRHIIVTAPDTANRRRIVEVYELLNDSVHTVIGTEKNPVWRATLPPHANDVQINPEGDISPAMTKVERGGLIVFAPVSPGLRQLSFTYTLGPDEFPWVMPVVDSTAVFELLVQESDAMVEGGGFTEVRGVQQDGIPFRRFLSQAVPGRAAIRFSMPKPVSMSQSRFVEWIAGSVLALMLAVLAFVFWRRSRGTRRTARTAEPAGSADDLVRELAVLDADFERRRDATPGERAEFDARRDAIKARLNAALAAEQGRG